MQRRRIQAFRGKAARGASNNGEVIGQEVQSGLLVGSGSTLVPTEKRSTLVPTIVVSPGDGVSLLQNSQANLPQETQENVPDSSDDESLDEDYGVLPRIGYTSDSSGAEEGEVKDSRGRKRIRPTGRNSFEGCKGILRNAYSIMHCYYKGPWRKWSRVPKEHIDIWWEEFKKRFFWKDKNAAKIYRNWRAKCSEHLRSTLCDARNSGKRPDFIEPEHWEEMLKGWEQDDTFKRQSEMNKCNRASEAPNGIGMFVGGAKPLVKIRTEYERKHGKRMSQEKLVEKAYRKRNGEWSSEKIPIALEKYKALCERFRETHSEEITEKDANNLWFEAIGGKKKDKALCLAALGITKANIQNSACSSHRSSNINRSEIEEIRRTIEEDLRKQIEDEVQRSMEARMQELLMKQRQEDAITYQRMLEMQRSRYVLPTPQVDTTQPYAPSFVNQQRYVEQLPASTHLFDASAFAAVQHNQDAHLNGGYEGGSYIDRSRGQFSG